MLKLPPLREGAARSRAAQRRLLSSGFSLADRSVLPPPVRFLPGGPFSEFYSRGGAHQALSTAEKEVEGAKQECCEDLQEEEVEEEDDKEEKDQEDEEAEEG
jgi:hypothetical protein